MSVGRGEAQCHARLIKAATVDKRATVAIALLWMRLFPTLREVEKLE